MAFEPAELFQTHSKWLRTVISSRVSDRAVVDDLIQEVFLAVMRKSDELAAVEKIEPWLYRVAVRTVLQYRRKTGRYRRRLQTYWEKQPDDMRSTSEEPRDWIVHEETSSQLSSAMQKLQERDREMLLLKHAHGWTYRQIAEHMGVAPSTIEYRLERARRNLRSLMNALASTEVP